MRKSFFCLALIALAVLVAGPVLAQGTNAAQGQAAPHNDNGGRPPIPAGPTILWDNGDTDGSNGYSNATAGAFGFRRTVLDDFEVPTGEQWSITDFHWISVWGSGTTLKGTDGEFSFHTDAGGAPAFDGGPASVISYTEDVTGRIFFSRPEAVHWVDFDKFVLGEGIYWYEGTVVGPENNFWLIKAVPRLSDCWVNYDDLGGQQSCITQFGVGGDFSWYLTGNVDGGCVLQHRVPRRARRGSILPVSMKITHNKIDTANVPFHLTVEDMAGTVVASHTTGVFTLEYGRTVFASEGIALPSGMSPGLYDVVVSMDEMRGGRAVAKRRIRVR